MFCRLVAVFGIVVALAQPSFAAMETKQQKIQELIELTGAKANMTQVMNTMWPQIMGMIAKSNPNIPADVLASLKTIGQAEFEASFPDLIGEMAKIYEINFSDEEVDGMLAFYSSPIGRSVTSKMPVILSQGMAVARVWGVNIGNRAAQKVIAALKQKGYQATL